MATKMSDFKEIINQSVSCFDDSALEVLSCIADDRSNCDLIVKRFGGKLAVRYYIGMESLKTPQRIKLLALDWFRCLIVEQGININDVTSGAFLLTLHKNKNDDSYYFNGLYTEIISWAKREFDIDLMFMVKHDASSQTNEFNFVAGLSGDINNYKNKIQLWHSGELQ